MQAKSKIRAVIGLMTICVVFCLCGPAGAQVTGEPIEEFSVETYRAYNKYALIVGINDYVSEEVDDLKYAVRDAEELYRVITDRRRGEFPPEQVMLLTDSSGTPPTANNIGEALTSIRKRAREDDLVLIFFSGHGLEDRGRAYLLPMDANLEALNFTAIQRDAFVLEIDSIIAKKVVVVLDACHAGGISRGGKGVGRDTLSERYYEQFSGAQGRAFIASCAGGQNSFEAPEYGQGIFTHTLVRGLSGEADNQPRDGLVTLHELRLFLEEKVSDWARRNGKEQQPQVNLEQAYGDMPIAKNADFLEAQAAERKKLKDETNEIKNMLIYNEVALTSSEMAAALELLDRRATGAGLTSDEEQHFELIRNLSVGSISVDTYRKAVRGLSTSDVTQRSTTVITDDTRLTLGRGWFVTPAMGGFLHAGEEFSGGVQPAPYFRVGYTLGRWSLVGSYVYASGELDESQLIQSFTAHLLTVGPRLNLPLSSRVLSYLQLGIGGYLGSEVRDDKANFALDVGAGLEVKLKNGISLPLSISWVFSNAALIPPTEPQLDQGLYFGVGISYARIK